MGNFEGRTAEGRHPAWERLCADKQMECYCLRMVRSMPRCVHACTKARGAPTPLQIFHLSVSWCGSVAFYVQPQCDRFECITVTPKDSRYSKYIILGIRAQRKVAPNRNGSDKKAWIRRTRVCQCVYVRPLEKFMDGYSLGRQQTTCVFCALKELNCHTYEASHRYSEELQKETHIQMWLIYIYAPIQKQANSWPPSTPIYICIDIDINLSVHPLWWMPGVANFVDT